MADTMFASRSVTVLPTAGLQVLVRRLRERREWKVVGVLERADPALAGAWWSVMVMRGVLPAVFGIAMGVLVGAVQQGVGLGIALAFAGVVFILLQILTPIHQAISANLGDAAAGWLHDQLTEASVSPRGIAHLEDATLADDLVAARDFDLGISGSPLSISMDFLAIALLSALTVISGAIVLA